MTRRGYIGLVILVLATGLVGGAIGSILSPIREADAQAGFITIRGFRLVDESNRTRALLGVSQDDGGVRFGLLDEAGTSRVVLGAIPSGSGLVIFDQNSTPRISLNTLEGGGQGLHFNDEWGVPYWVVP